jgi:integrase
MARQKIERPRLKEKTGRPFRVHYRYERDGRSFSTGTTDRAEAEKILRRAEAFFDLGDDPAKANPNVDLEAGLGSILWDLFRDRYAAYVRAVGLKRRTIEGGRSALNLAEQILRPRRLRDVASREALKRFSEALKAGRGGKGKPRSSTTVRSVLVTLRAALAWAQKDGLIDDVPSVELPKLPKGRKAKGRPLLGEEIDRFRDAVRREVGKDAAPSWLRLVDGLLASGLRLSELMSLHWTDESEIHPIRVSCVWVLRLPSDRHKGTRHEDRPVWPAFAEILDAVSESERIGYIFDPLSLNIRHGRRSRTGRVSAAWVGKILARAGQKEGIVVDHQSGKRAGAHDLRRTMAQGLSDSGVPLVRVAKILGHRSTDTTENYYAVNETAVRESIELDRYYVSTKPSDEQHAKPSEAETLEAAHIGA